MSERNLERLRKLIADHDLGYYLVLTQDAHHSEYVSPCDKRREFISGFTGSAGIAVIGRDGYAELSTDGRYWLQAGSQLGSSWALRKEGSSGVIGWIKAISARAKAEGVAIGVDPRLISYSAAKQIMSSGADLVAVEPNLVDQIWKDQPAEPANPVFALGTQYTGQSRESKIADLRHQLKTANADAIVLSALDQIAWLLNLRGSDVPFNPIFKSFLVVTHNETALYISESHPLPSKEELGDIVVKPYDSVFDDLQALSYTMGKSVWVPPKSSWALVKAAGVRAILNRESPVELAKAIKNEVEIAGARRAQEQCGYSVLQLLSWVTQQVKSGHEVTEFKASEKLQEFREKLPEYRGPSFETISSSGPNAAEIHYSPPAVGSRPLSKSEVYLVDSGSQFNYGTTDTTRTTWLGDSPAPAEIREAYTLVLKGHIALATAIFREGGSGYKLDAIARQPLNKYGYDYNHGTGHGVGSFLNVHEGPILIGYDPSRAAAPLEVGNILSNEPGYYKEDHYGIRIESLLVVGPAQTKYTTDAHFLQFETITMVPFDANLIDVSILTSEEIDWINTYHERCRDVLLPKTSGDVRDYLLFHTQPLAS